LKFSEFERRKKYSEASGSMPVVDSNIEMRLNDFGLFEERLININKGVTQLAEEVSPNFNITENETKISNELYSNIEGTNYDEKIGFFQSLYVGHVRENDYREKASSGGMGTWIFKELFEKDLIDYVIHVKKDQDLSTDTLFKYDISSTIEGIKDGAKTRYYPVEISEVMQILKEKPGRYAIVGIPSFIYSVRLLAKKDPIINERLKYTVGLICGHQKSTKFAELMAWQVGIKPGDLIDIDFRHKLFDRPASQYGVKMTGIINGKKETIIKPKSELYGQDWGLGLFKPIASNFTDDVFNETADIVLGDAWLPEYSVDSKGNNIVIIRNPEIDKLVTNAINKNKLEVNKVDTNTIYNSQDAHYRHTHDELRYRLYKKNTEKEWSPKKRVKPSNNISKSRKRVQDLRESLSLQSHIKYQEALEKKDFNYFIEEMSNITNEYDKVYKKINRKKRLKKVKKLGLFGSLNRIIQKLNK